MQAVRGLCHKKPPASRGCRGLGSGGFFFLAAVQQVGHRADGHIGVCVDTLDQRLELDGLEAVDHNVQHRLGRVRVEAVGVYDGQARAEFLRHGAGDLVRVGRNDHGCLGAVKAVHDEVYGLGARRVGDDGVEWQYPAAHDDAADYVQQHVVNQHKCTDGQPERLCKDDSDDLNAVHRAAVADGQAAANARDDAAEQRTQKQIRARQRRGNADVDGQHIGDEPGRHRVDADRKDGVNREHRPLPLEAEQQQRDVEQDQEEGQRKIVRRQLGEQDGCAGDAAVVQLYRRNKQRYTDSIDDARDQQHQKMEGRELG